MLYSCAPLEGLTGRQFRKVHQSCFPGADRYYMPFLSPAQGHVFSPKELRELDPVDIAQLIEELPRRAKAAVFRMLGKEQAAQVFTYLEGEDVSAAIRRHKVSGAASQVSAIPEVRAFLLDVQRRLAEEHSVVMDGRDIGTVVLPDAEVKIYLTASAQARAERRMLELENQGTPQPYEDVLREIEERDYNDSHRAAAPLRLPEDGVTLDTTGLDFRQSLERLLEIIRGRMAL